MEVADMMEFIDITTIANVGIWLLAGYGLIKLIVDRNDADKCAAIMWVLKHACEECSPPKRGMYARDICTIAGISQSSIYLHLGKLEEQGFVGSTRDEQWPHRYRYHFIPEVAREQMKQPSTEP